jgi:CheY-like chemotaxis protein
MVAKGAIFAPCSQVRPRGFLAPAMQKVLVVDDEPELVRLLGRTLGAAGFAAVGAPSGERALELVSEHEFDAALVDKNLGRGIDGVEVLRHLRKRQPRCACIMMTAYPSMGSAVEALRIGAQDYVEKPSPELDTIADRIQSAIRAVQLRDERDGLLLKLTALQQEMKDKDSRVRDLEIQLAMAEQVGTVRADEGTEPLLHASRDRDARLVQAAEKLVQMARFLRANEMLVRAIEAHVSALRLG